MCLAIVSARHGRLRCVSRSARPATEGVSHSQAACRRNMHAGSSARPPLRPGPLEPLRLGSAAAEWGAYFAFGSLRDGPVAGRRPATARARSRRRREHAGAADGAQEGPLQTQNTPPAPPQPTRALVARAAAGAERGAAGVARGPVSRAAPMLTANLHNTRARAPYKDRTWPCSCFAGYRFQRIGQPTARASTSAAAANPRRAAARGGAPAWATS